MYYNRLIARWWIFGGISCILASAAGAAVIDVMPVTSQNITLQVGQTITISVNGTVSDPQDGNDGIFTFDQNLIVAPVPSGQPDPLQIVSITRPGVDDTLYGGSDGTAVSTGVNNIYGGYDGESEGIGTPVTLYTVTLQAVTPGAAVVSSGPSVTPYGADFVLNETASPAVDYATGPTITIVPAPEPAMVSGWLASCIFFFRRGLVARKSARA